MTTPTRLFTPAFIALALAELAYFTAAGLAIPTTPLFASGPLGADEAGIGLAVGAFSVTALILRPLAGRMADARGRRPLLIGGALLCALAMGAQAFAPNLAVLVVLRLTLGVAEAFFFVAGFAALADLAPAHRTGEALSFNSLSLYLGIALGPLIGELLLDAGGFGLAWGGGAALALAAAILATRIPETADRTQGATGPRPPLIHPAAIGPGLALASGVSAMAGFFAFVAIHARNLGMDGAGGVLLLFGLVVVSCRIAFARLPDRLPPFRVGAAALTGCGIGLLLPSLVPTPIGLLVGAVVMAMGVAFVTPAFFAAIFSVVPASERGAASGTASICLDLAFGGGPMLLGLVAGASNIPTAFAVGAGVDLIGAAATAAVPVLGRRTAPA
jgi:MFS family permease